MPLSARRFLGGLITLGLAVVIGLLLYWGKPGNSPKTIFRVIGFSRYSHTGIPPIAFGHQDAREFHATHTWTVISNSQTGRGLRFVLGKPATSDDGDDSNLVVLLSLHGIVAKNDKAPPRALFLAENANPDSPFQADSGAASPVIRLSEFLDQLEASLKEPSTRNVLLLIDAGRLRPNWRLGHLSNDLPTQIKREVKDRNLKNLHVIVSCDAGETSWTMNQRPISVFSHYVLEGLGGFADATPKNRRITCSELASYLKIHVQKWARENRGVTQSVVWLPPSPDQSDFDLVAVPDKQQSTPDETAGQSVDPTEEDPEETAATETGEPSDKKTAETGKPSAGDPGSDPAVTSTNDTGESSPSAEKLEAGFKRLNGLWGRRDTHRRKESKAVLLMPRRWRALQICLLRCEQLLLCQASADNKLDLAVDMLDEFDKLKEPDRPADLPVPRDGTRRTAIQKLCDDIWNFDETSQDTSVDTEPKPAAVDGDSEIPTRQKLIDELAGHLDKSRNPQTATAAQLAVAQRLVSLVRLGKQLGQPELRKCRTILGLIGALDLPSQLTLLNRLTDTAFGSQETGIEWDDEFAEWCHEAFVLRVDLEDFAADNSDLLPRLGEDLSKALEHTTAAERWLVHGARVNARRHLDKATKYKKAVTDNKILIGGAVHLRATLMAEIPDFARWIANRIEDDPRRCRKLTFRQPARELLEIRDRFSRLDQSPLTRPEEQSLLKMVHRVRRLNHLLDAPADDAGTQEELADIYTKLGNDSRRFQKTFRDHVERLEGVSPDNLTAADWRQIDILLEIPWVSSESRRKLRRRLCAARSSSAASDAETRASRELAGVWQAFWAIQTLSLAVPSSADSPKKAEPPDGAVVDLDSLWDLWDGFFDDTDTAGNQQDQHAIMLARLRLGREINRVWHRNANDLVNLAKTISLLDGQQSLLVRTLDGADAMDDPGLAPIDSKIQGSRVTSAEDLLEQHAEWSRSQQPPDWLKRTWLPQRIDFAARTSRADSSYPIKLSVHPKAMDKEWTLAFEGSSKIQPELNGEKIIEPVPFTPETLKGLRIKLDKNPGLSWQWLTIALLDESQFPVALKRIPVIPPFDPTEWRIVFLADGESKEYLDGRRSGRNRLVVTTGPGTPVTILQLPPSPEATAESGDPKGKDAAGTKAPGPPEYRLKPFLWRPEKDESQSVIVTVFQRINAVDKRQFLHGKFALARSDRLIPLVFKKLEVDPPVDLSNGLIFELELRTDADSKAGARTVEYRIQPDFWHPGEFLHVSDPKFEGLRLSLEVGPLLPVDPHLLPPSLEVELCLPPELQAIANKDESFLKGRVGSRSKPLYAEFSEKHLALLEDRVWPVSLTVAGFPRAFSWQLKYGSRSAAQPAVLRIIAPANGPVFDISEPGKDKPGRLVIGINSPDLKGAIHRNPWKLDKLWSLTYRFADDKGRLLPGLQREIPLRYPVWKRFELRSLNEKSGFWTLRGQVGDHDTVSDRIPFPEVPGRYSLQAVLKSGSDGDVVRAEDQMKIGVDTARNKPRVTDIVFESPFELDRDLSIKLTAQDSESGIRRVAVGFDNNDDGKLNDEEVLNFRVERRIAGPAILTTTRFELILPKSKVMKQGTGKKTLLVRATNGIKIDSDWTAKTITLVRADGYLIVEWSNARKRKTLTLTGPNRFSENLTIGRSASKAELKRNKRIPLPPGTYTLTDDLFKHAVEFTVDSRKEYVAKINYGFENDPKPIRSIRPKSP